VPFTSLLLATGAAAPGSKDDVENDADDESVDTGTGGPSGSIPLISDVENDADVDETDVDADKGKRPASDVDNDADDEDGDDQDAAAYWDHVDEEVHRREAMSPNTRRTIAAAAATAAGV
jgi:hypothetical protein